MPSQTQCFFVGLFLMLFCCFIWTIFPLFHTNFWSSFFRLFVPYVWSKCNGIFEVIHSLVLVFVYYNHDCCRLFSSFPWTNSRHRINLWHNVLGIVDLVLSAAHMTTKAHPITSRWKWKRNGSFHVFFLAHIQSNWFFGKQNI